MESHLDSLLTHLGTGKWSILHFFATSFLSVFLAPHALGGALLSPRLDFSCRVPSSITLHDTTSFPNLLQDSNSSSADDHCEYRIHTPDGERIEECLEFDFDNSTFTSTFTSEYNLTCGRSYLQTSFQSIYMLGIFIGAPINGYMSDRYGRKPIMVVGVVLYLTLALVSAWLPWLSVILMSRFLLGFLHAVCCYTSYVLMVEVIEPKMRTIAGYTIYVIWSLGMMVYGALGYLIRDWRTLQTVATLPGLICLPALWFIDESPRWLIVNGHIQGAFRVLSKVARWHGVDLPTEPEMKRLAEEETPKVHSASQLKSSWVLLKAVIDESVVLVRTPRLRIITLCILLIYLVGGMVYFGLSLSGASISDDPFVFMVLSGAMEVPAYTLTVPVVERFGRKLTLSVFLFINAGVLFALAFTPAVYSITVIVLAMIGKLAITGGFQTIIFFSSELFPTEVRSRGIGVAFMMSRIGSMVSPFITDLVGVVYPWAPFVVFASGAFLAGAGTFLLPETRGQILPDTVAQLEEKVREAPKKTNKVERLFEGRVSGPSLTD